MQYYMEYCQNNKYVTPQDWLKDHKHFNTTPRAGSEVTEAKISEEEIEKECKDQQKVTFGSGDYHKGFEDSWYLCAKWAINILSTLSPERAEVKEGWISVDDRLPEVGDADRLGLVSAWDIDNIRVRETIFSHPHFTDGKYTLWQPLPSPPEGQPNTVKP